MLLEKMASLATDGSWLLCRDQYGNHGGAEALIAW